MPRTRISNGVMAVVFVLFVEAMFFAGLVSAYLVARSNTFDWPPAGQPRLPIERTAINTAILLLSAPTMLRCVREKGSWSRARGWLIATFALGAGFVAMQGVEWARLIGFGLSRHVSLYGAFFYLIVGAHAAHAVVGLLVLTAGLFGWMQRSSLRLAALYWYFVVALWPVLYGLVYLS